MLEIVKYAKFFFRFAIDCGALLNYATEVSQTAFSIHRGTEIAHSVIRSLTIPLTVGPIVPKIKVVSVLKCKA